MPNDTESIISKIIKTIVIPIGASIISFYLVFTIAWEICGLGRPYECEDNVTYQVLAILIFSIPVWSLYAVIKNTWFEKKIVWIDFIAYLLISGLICSFVFFLKDALKI